MYNNSSQSHKYYQRGFTKLHSYPLTPVIKNLTIKLSKIHAKTNDYGQPLAAHHITYSGKFKNDQMHDMAYLSTKQLKSPILEYINASKYK